MAGTQHVTILFCDLVASTERRARLGDDAFDEFSARFMTALHDAIAEHQGRVVKSAGDGLMVVFPDSVVNAVLCAADMHRSVAELDADDPPRLRIGISAGEVATRGDDYSGMPIVEAARLEAAAAPGQTLANAVVRALVGSRRAIQFRDIGSLTLKGIPEPLATVAVLDEAAGDAPLPTPATVARTGDKPRRRTSAMVGAVVVLAAVALVAGLLVARSNSNAPAHQAAAAAGVPTPKGYTPTYQTARCSADVRKLAGNAECGTLTVPEDRAKPNGMKVHLPVTRAPARLAGALGAPTIDLCGCEDIANSLARDHSELVHLGARGYDGSPQLKCPEFVTARLAALTKPSNDSQELAAATDGLRQCHARLVKSGIDPAQFNDAVAARDVLDLMWALHFTRANFVAFQESAVQAFALVREAPGAVRSLTLDNPPPPGDTTFTSPISDFSGAFDRFVAACRADHSCAGAYPDLAAQYRAAYQNAERSPQLVTGTASWDPKPRQVLLDGPRIADSLANALNNSDALPAIPAAITQPTGAVEAGIVLDEERLVLDAPWGAQASYYCAYRVHTVDTTARSIAARALPEFVGENDTHWPQWCKGWNVPDVSGTLGTDVVSDVPVLAFRGNLASRGDPDWLPKIQRGFSAMQTLVFPSLGFDQLAGGPPCLSELRRAFLRDPKASLAAQISACKAPKIAFVAPSG